MTRYTSMNGLVEDLKSFAAKGFPESEIRDYLAEIHSVENVPEFGDSALSLHVYSRPHAECDIYDSETGPKRRVELAYDSIHGKPVDRIAT